MGDRMGLKAALAGAAAVALALSVTGGALAANTVKLHANLMGKNEVPEADKKAKGKADMKLKKKKKKKVCFDISFRDMQNPTAGHIHKGAKGVNGPIKVTLFENENGATSPTQGCVKNVNKNLIKKIGKKPENWYVNLHTPDFPGGAARGQLANG